LSNKKTPFLVGRTCTRKQVKAAGECRSLEGFRELYAYVLLGDPGAGKTASFMQEAIESGGEYIRARDFATFDPRDEYKVKTLFIDGLDEMRAGGGDGRTSLDHIRRHLDRLGCPRFRLSCREADWLGASDQEALKCVSPNGEVAALHLDRLSDDDIAEILKHKENVSDADSFMRQAQEHGLGDLLRNPQALSLLVKAVGGDVWPKSRKQVYAMACEKLVSDPNPEHRYAKRDTSIFADALLGAAGYLCAIQLLASNAGFALDEASADDQHPCWQILPQHDMPLLAALKTNLFQSDGEALRIPVHRSVAEFLGARYLATRMNDGLPHSRLLTLITGEDGGVVTDLRGLAAWLAVHSRSARQTLIERDPLGVVLYGDVRGFSVADKQMVLEALADEAERYPWFRSDDWADSPFDALGTMDMEPIFQQMLSSSSRSNADQALLDCVLDAIQYGEQMPGLATPLEAIIRGSSYMPHIRKNALWALIHGVQAGSAMLLHLAQDVRDGLIEDNEDELIGALLKELYPEVISPAEIFEYLHQPKSDSINSYRMFWRHYLERLSNNTHLPILLDWLSKERAEDKKIPYTSRFDRMAGALLVRGMTELGDSISDELLYQWLGVVLDEFDFPRMDNEPLKQISAWFEGRPERFKSLIEYAELGCSSAEDAWGCMQTATRRISFVPTPADIEAWYLKKAADVKDKELARFYFVKAVQPLLQHDEAAGYLPISQLERLAPWINANPECEMWLEPYTSCPIGGWEQEHGLHSQQWGNEDQKKKTELIAFYRQHIDAIRDGSAYPQIMHDLALAYDGHLSEAHGDTPLEQLEMFFGNDNELVDAAISGFLHTLKRADLPTVKEISDLAVKGIQPHYIRSACLIGMNHLFRINPDEALGQSDENLVRLLVFRLSDGMGDEPEWFVKLVHTRPDLVAGAFLACIQPMLRARKEHITGLHLLTGESAYVEVARLVLPKLMEGFPVRAGVGQLPYMLGSLLKAALRYLSKDYLAGLAAKKSALASMDAAQKTYWLALGLLLMPNEYEDQLLQFVGKSQKRKGHLVGFLYESFGRRNLPDWVQIPERTLARIVELFGPDCKDTLPSGVVTAEMRAADMVRSYIAILGNTPEESVSKEIERLLTLPSLSHWHNRLRHAQHSQRIARRKATFRRLSVAQVAQSIANLQPANAADLAALTFEQLRDIARKIRDGNTNDYRQYWSFDSSRKQSTEAKSKPENDCRDALLSDLQERLGKLGVDAQPESNYADNKRADIKVSFGDSTRLNVPIEIKKDTHADLWSAIHDQLVAKYVRDTGTDGYGIYLVFWFGGKGMRPPTDGVKLRSAKALEDKLRETLSQEEAHRIKICVIDCSLP